MLGEGVVGSVNCVRRINVHQSFWHFLCLLPFVSCRKTTFCKPNIYLVRDFPQARSERKMLEEELMELNNRVAELISETGEAAIQRLQDEIKDCKSMLKCSVFGPA